MFHPSSPPSGDTVCVWLFYLIKLGYTVEYYYEVSSVKQAQLVDM
jgi:hypothetical protein